MTVRRPRYRGPATAEIDALVRAGPMFRLTKHRTEKVGPTEPHDEFAREPHPATCVCLGCLRPSEPPATPPVLTPIPARVNGVPATLEVDLGALAEALNARKA